MDKREEDVQKLCEAVLIDGIQWENSNNEADCYRCIFCYGSVPDWKAREDIQHSLDCPYLIAKDLNTGLKEVKYDR